MMNLKDKNITLETLHGLLCDFVEKICKGRDESHGYEHMTSVTKRAMDILSKECDKDEFYDNKLIKVMIVSMLHDVADHKYDKDGDLQKQVINFLETFYDDPEQIIKIIDYISYSKEKKAIDNGCPIDFIKELGDVDANIRHIVSDSDKCEALGKMGLRRCVEYTQHSYKQKYNIDISFELLKEEVINHSNEKLLRLKDDFIRTKTGKLMAGKLHIDFVMELEHLFPTIYK